jgi:branched-chain amino acid transport system substrate-binding protein
MKKLLVLILLIGLVGCSKEPIKVGIVATLSGSNSEIGVSLRDGIILRIEELNEEGGIDGRKIELYTRDDKNDPDLVEKYNRELYDMDVDVIFGYELSSKYALIREFVEQDVIVISPTLSSYKASKKDDNFFRTIATNQEQGHVLADYANDTFVNTLIIYDDKNYAFAEGVIEGYLELFEGSVDYFPIDEPHSIERQLIDQFNHDSVLFVMNPNDCATVSQIFYKNDIEVQLLSSSWGMVSDGYKSAGKAMEGTVFSSHIGNKSYGPYQDFILRYKAKYNEEPQFASIYAYEAALMYFAALEKAGTTDKESVRHELLSLSNLPGVISNLEFDEYGDIKRKNYVAIIIDGELIIQE